MRRLFMAALLLLATTARGRAAALDQGPSSGDWGPGAWTRLQGIFNDLLDRSGYDLPEWLSRENRTPTRLIIDENAPPGVAVAASQAAVYNGKDHAEVHVNQHLFEVCHTSSEAAFVLGHELGHLLRQTTWQLDQYSDDLERNKMPAWLAGDGRSAYESCLASAPEQRCFIEARIAFTKAHADDISQFARRMERQADDEAAALLPLSHYDPTVGPRVMRELAQWSAAEGIPANDDVHDPIEERERRAQAWVDAMQAALHRP